MLATTDALLRCSAWSVDLLAQHMLEIFSDNPHTRRLALSSTGSRKFVVHVVSSVSLFIVWWEDVVRCRL